MNSVLTPQVIANELLRRFENNLGFSQNVEHEYDEKFARDGAKIGDTLQLRKPVRFIANDGQAIVIQDVTELSTSLSLNIQKHVAFQFSSKDLTLTIDRFSERYLKSASVALANAVDVVGLTMGYQTCPNAVGTPGTVPNALTTYLQAGEALDRNSTPMDGDRTIVINPKMQTNIVDALKGLFQAGDQIARQYKRGRMGTVAGFEWVLDQNVRTHTTGALGGTPLVNGVGQTGSSLITDGWTAAAATRLKKGDIFTIANVFAVNPVSGDKLSDLQQFTCTSDLASDGSGNLTATVYPPITATGPNKTVDSVPADNAALTVLGAASTATPQGIAFHKEAYVLGMAPLQVPQGVHFAAKQMNPDTGVSVRIVSDYDIATDLFITRCDILFGWAALHPEWACRIAS